MGAIVIIISLGLLALEIFLSVRSLKKGKNYLSWFRYGYAVIAFIGILFISFSASNLRTFPSFWQEIVEEGLVGSEALLKSEQTYKSFLGCMLASSIIASLTYLGRFIFCVYQRINLKVRKQQKPIHEDIFK